MSWNQIHTANIFVLSLYSNPVEKGLHTGIRVMVNKMDYYYWTT